MESKFGIEKYHQVFFGRKEVDDNTYLNHVPVHSKRGKVGGQ